MNHEIVLTPLIKKKVTVLAGKVQSFYKEGISLQYNFYSLRSIEAIYLRRYIFLEHKKCFTHLCFCDQTPFLLVNHE